MEEAPSRSRVVKFGTFEVDLNSGELRKSGMRQNLAGQPFEALRILLEHHQEIVSRDELRKHLWPDDTFVDFDLALKRVINRVREALGDSAENPRFIETIPRRGYRFIAPVSEVGSAPPVEQVSIPETAVETKTPERNLRPWILLGVGVAAMALILWAFAGVRPRWLRFQGTVTPQIHSLAVLPLQNLSNDPAQEYFSDGMTDALITDLAQIGNVRVISRTSSMQYKLTKKSLPEIARELQVEGIVEGTVQRSGDRVRITAQLIHGPSDKHLWAHSYERDLRDVFALERDVTEDIARQVQVRITAAEGNLPSRFKPVDPKVLDAYLQGNYHLNRYGQGPGEEELTKAAEYFRQAIERDPNFAPAYVGLANTHGSLLRGSSEDTAVIKKNLEKAVELDPNSSEAQEALAFIKWQPGLDWHGAEEGLRRAIALSPNSASAHSSLGLLLVAMRRMDEGLRECNIAQQLDPNQDNSSLCLYCAHDYDGAIARLRIMLQKNPNDGFSHYYIWQNYAMKGMDREAIQELAQGLSLFGLTKAAVNIQRAFAVSGYRGAIRRWAREMEELQRSNQVYLPGNLAFAYTILGDKDRAFYWLEQAYEHREMVSIDGGIFSLGSEPMYDPLRSDPRFEDLLRRVGLPP